MQFYLYNIKMVFNKIDQYYQKNDHKQSNTIGLAPNWIRRISNNVDVGRVYYFNLITGKSQWKIPISINQQIDYSPTTIVDLDDRIMHILINHLDNTSVSILSQTTRQFRNLIKDVKNIDISNMDLTENQLMSLVSFFPQLTNIKKLDISFNFKTNTPKINTNIANVLARSLSQMRSLTHLNLANCAENASVMEVILQSLVGITELTYLKLKGNRFDYETFAPILANMLKLEYLNLKDTSDDGTQIKALAPILSRMPNLTYLNLGSNYISEKSANEIAPYLEKMSQLTYFNFGRNKGGCSENLLLCIQGMQNLTHLTLNMIVLESSLHITLIGSIFNKTPNLVYLNLSSNKLGPTGLFELASHLAKLSNLENLNLSNSHMWSKCNELIPSLLQLSKLTHLDLSHNYIGPNVNELGECFVQMPNLIHLNLGYNRFFLDDQVYNGVKEFVPCLSRLSKLKYLNIQHNSLSTKEYWHEDDVEKLGEGLEHMTELTYLNISHSKIGNKGLKDLVKHIYVMSKLTHLFLNDIQISEDSVEMLGLLLQFMPKLTNIELSRNKIGDKGVEFLKERFNQLKSLKQISFFENNLTSISTDALKELAIAKNFRIFV
jgi:Ran GTPase-activating protein (RanGAP) involved in mRNA processing and transport